MAEAHWFPAAEQAIPLNSLPLRDGWTSLTAVLFRTARANKDRVFAKDVTGSITYGEVLERGVAISCVLKRIVGDARNVGVLVPPSIGGALANVAITFLGKVAVNLSYALKEDALNANIRKAGITTVVTSKAAMEKFGFKLDAQVIYLEDIKDWVTGLDKAYTALVARYVPEFALGAFLAGARAQSGDDATIMFTTGSTGDPKGVRLSHGNILSNILAVTQHVDLADEEVILGVLPFFHSFGFTVALWTTLCLGKTVIYHPNTLDVKEIAALVERHKVTLMASTPTLMRSYLKRATREQFASVRMLLLGSEKLKAALATELQEKLGLVPVEAYGATECSPGISANVPRNVRTPDGRTVWGNKLGSVGQPMPGVSLAIVDMNTGKLLSTGQEGLIFVHGPNVMQGYFDMPQQTAEVLRNGWYCTGDVGYIDEDGFLWITDRLSRFAKVGGEMVPLVKVEAALLGITKTNELTLSVVAVPDTAKGERVAVVYTEEMGMPPAQLCKSLSDSGTLPSLWLPKPGDFVLVDKLPTGPTGKLDLKAVKTIALEKLGS